MTTSNKVMDDIQWISVYPSLTEEMLSFVAEKIETFFGVNF